MGASGSHGPWGDAPPSERDRLSYADAVPRPYWLDRPGAPADLPSIEDGADTQLAIVGGGLSGLWAALLAKEDDPSRDVVLLEGDTIAQGASGRNGGFVMSSLTHGAANGMARFPDEMPELERLGLESFEQMAATIERHGIDCSLERTGELLVAVEGHERDWVEEDARLLLDLGHEVELLDREELQAEVHSPLYLAGRWQRSGAGILDPAHLTWGLCRAARSLGVRIYERSPVLGLGRTRSGVALRTPHGTLHAERALLACGAYRPLVREVRRRIVPVYDYVLVTEPLSAEQWASLGWRRRQGIGDSANRFHYYRPTADGRILWGGYDAVYHWRNGVGPGYDQSGRTFARLAQHFFTAFPQLEDVRFSHRWGGPIDTCSRFFAFHGLAEDGRVAYSAGHTGLGVGASRFGARLALDLLDGRESPGSRLRALRARPLPFPPEPLRSAVIQLTRSRLAAADRNGGRRGLWLRLLDRLGLGFDS